MSTNVGRDGKINLPATLLENVNEPVEYEVVLRPLSVRAQKSGEKTVAEEIKNIEATMNARYPNLRKDILPELKKVIGVSRNINTKYAQYSDREIIGMARMEKYLEKAEILESLY